MSDLVAVTASWLVVQSLLNGIRFPRDPLLQMEAAPLWVVGLVTVLLYHYATNRGEATTQALACGKIGQLTFKLWLAICLGVIGFIAFRHDYSLSRAFWAGYLLSLPAAIFLGKFATLHFIHRAVVQRPRQTGVLLVGDNRRGEEWRSWFGERPWLGFKLCGQVEVPDALRMNCLDGDFAEIYQRVERELKERRPSIVMSGLSLQGAQLITLRNLVESHGAHLMLDLHAIVGSDSGAALPSSVLSGVVGFHSEPLASPLNRILKRLFDIAVSLPVVVFILPPLALAVWLLQRLVSPGPLFFVQERGGRDGQPFAILKFRSMQVSNPDETRQARPGDSRCYFGGDVLRKLSLDEFPQFINVLLGHMSVIGPRPHMLSHDSMFAGRSRGYRMRQRIKPGITGLAQVLGHRGPLDDERDLGHRVQADLRYAETWSFGLDLRILFKTVLHVFAFHPKSC